MGRRILTIGGVALAVIVVLGLGMAVFNSEQAQLRAAPGPTSTAPTRGCSPAPCSNVKGYLVWISGVSVTGDVVSMHIAFQNSSDSTHASPQDLQLSDSRQRRSGLITDAPGCTTWTRHEFSNGATFVPGTICFRISSVTPPLVLHWEPDFGFLCCRADIKLD